LPPPPSRSASSRVASSGVVQMRGSLLYGIGAAIMILSLVSVTWSTRYFNRLGYDRENIMSSALHKSKVQFLGDDNDDENDNISNNLRQSATEAIDIVRFVAYNGLGFFTENNNNDDDDDYNVDNSGDDDDDDDDIAAVSINIDPSHQKKKKET